MKLNDTRIRLIRGQLVTLLILALALAGYLLHFVPNQRRHVVERNFRVLAGMAQQIEIALGNLGTSLTNAVSVRDGALVLRPDFPTNSPISHAIVSGRTRATNSTVSSAGAATNSTEALIGFVTGRLALVPAFQQVSVEPVAASTKASGTIHWETKGIGKGSWIELEYVGGTPTPAPTRSAPAETIQLRTRVRVDVAKLVDPIVNRSEFDDILITDAKGNVLFQIGSTALKVSELQSSISRSYQTNGLELAGTDYRLFAQPIGFASQAGPSETPADKVISWTVCGLERDSHFQARIRSFPDIVFVIFLFSLSLLIFGWPLLNVWSLAPRNSLGLGEALLLLGAIFSLVGVLTLITLRLRADAQLDDQSRQQLEGLSKSVSSNLDAELHRIARQLSDLNSRLAASAPAEPLDKTHLLGAPGVLRFDGDNPSPYPYFRMAVWIDRRTGDQLAKWTMKSQSTPLLRVDYRQYYRNLADDRPWRLPPEPGRRTEGELRYCLESIFSSNTGENQATFSMLPQNEWQVISTLDCAMLSLVNPIVPAGFGFCVIDAVGTVLFHSDSRKNLRENFLEECGRDPALRAAVASRESSHLETRYLNRLHRAFVSPLPGRPWTLITFQDHTRTDVALRQAVLMTTAVCTTYTVSFGVLVFLLCLLGLNLRTGAGQPGGASFFMAWLRPHPGRAGPYLALTIANLFLMFLAGFWSSQSHDPAYEWIPILVCPLAAAVLWCGWNWFESRRIRLTVDPLRNAAAGLETSMLRPASPWSESWQRHGAYVLALGTLLLTLAAVPVALVFRCAFAREKLLLQRQAQLHFAHDFEARSQRILAEVRAYDRGPSGSGTSWRTIADLFNRRLGESLDIHALPFLSSLPTLDTDAPVPREAASANHHWMYPFRWLLDDQSIATKAYDTPPSDTKWAWTPVDSSSSANPVAEFLTFHRAAVPIVGTTATNRPPVTIRIPPVNPLPARSSGTLWWLALVSVGVTPFCIVRLVALRLLVPPRDGASTIVAATDDPTQHSPLVLLIESTPGIAETTEASWPPRGPAPAELLTIDLAASAGREALAVDWTERMAAANGSRLVVKHLEHAHADPKFNDAKLRFLQQVAQFEQLRVIVFSRIHPLHFKLAATEAAATAVRSEWLAALARFRCRVLVGSDAPTPTGNRDHELRALWLTCSPGEQDLLRDLAAGRLVSCASRDYERLLDPRRGILAPPPANGFVSDAFLEFVSRQAPPVVRSEGATPDEVQAWDRFKGPIATTLIVVAAFFFITQKETFDSTVAWVTGFVAALTKVTTNLEFFSKAKPKKGGGD